MVEQNNILRKIKKLGTTICYKRPPFTKEVEISIFFFADGSKVDKNGQICVICVLFIRNMKAESVFHPIMWISHNSRRSVKSVQAAEVLSVAESIDEANIIAVAYSELFQPKRRVGLFVDSMDLFSSLSTQTLSFDRSFCGDVCSISYEFETGLVDQITWVPGKIK